MILLAFRRAYVGLGLAAAGFSILLFVGLRQFEEQRIAIQDVFITGGWTAVQTQVEISRFLESLGAFMTGGESYREDLNLRFEILLSRIGVLLVGEESSLVRAKPWAQVLIDDLAADVAVLEPTLIAITPDDVASYHKIRDTLRPYLRPFQELSRETIVSIRIDRGRSEINRATRRVKMAFGGIFLSVVPLLLLLYRKIRTGQILHNAAELARRQAVREKEKAEFANRAKSQFLTNMSHELRTPLNAIIGFSDTMAQQLLGSLTDNYRQYANDIRNAGYHLLELIEDILDLSKIESGVADLADEVVDSTHILATVTTLVAGQAERNSVTLERHVTGTVPRLRADPRKLKQILVNLLSNAVKFTASGGHVSITVGTADDGGLAFRIADNGIGMSEKDVAIALRPFQQVEDQWNRVHAGTGLGLPLAKSLVELHGGYLSITSVPNEGTEVTVVFPPSRVVAQPQHAATISRAAQPAAHAS